MTRQSDTLLPQDNVTIAIPPAKTIPTVRKRARVTFHTMMQWLHRWATLTLGLLLILVTLSGVVALYEFDLNRFFHPHLYQPTPATTPVSLDEVYNAFKEGIAAEPTLQGATFGDIVTSPTDTYHVYLYSEDEEAYMGQAFVDPGTGNYLGYYNEEETFWGWCSRLHYSLFADTITFTYPEWVPSWLSTWLGASLADLLLKNTALELFILVITGAYLWWPGIKKLALGFRIRPNAKGFVWHYDWHNVIGFISLPFLLMWAVTGLNFYSPYAEGIDWLWHTVTLSTGAPEEPEDLQSVPAGAAMISAEQAKTAALATVPDATFVSIAMPDTVTGTMDIWLSQGIDPYAYGEFPGQVYLRLDAYTGNVLYNSAAVDTGLASYIYEWWFYPIHAGVSVSWPVRTIWAVFGLLPLFLAYTGFMQWWIKRRKRLAMHARRSKTEAHQMQPKATISDVG